MTTTNRLETRARNPHAGLPFDDDDSAIARALEDVSIPALLCSLVHMTGDPSWIRSELRPQGSMLNEYQGYMPEEMKAEARRCALPTIAAYRDAGCVLPPPPSRDVLLEMMAFLACAPVSGDAADMFLEDLHLDGADSRAVTWGAAIPPEVKVDARVVVIGCGEAGLLAGMRKYRVEQHCRFNTEVTSATFDDGTGRWSVEVRTRDGRVEHLDAFAIISAVGALNQPHIPDIPGRDDFAGPWFHSARWDHSIDIRGKRFALVGAGASGFQIAPTIAPEVAQLTVFQRTAQWMFPNMHYHERVPDGDRWAMRHLPFYGRWFRFLTFYPGAGLSMDRSRIDPDYDDPEGHAISETNAVTRELFGGWIESQIGDDPELLAKVMPDYPPSAKRMLQDNGSWLACLKRDNVELVRTGIERVVSDGIVTVDGTHHPADVICYATGFLHNDYLWPMHIVGRGGVVLREQWGIEPTAYLGITVPNFPNLFCLYGPGTNLAHGASLIFQSECQVNYVMDALRRLLEGRHRTMQPRPEVHDEYRRRYEDEISQMVWSHWKVKHSHFKNPEGRIYTLSPWAIPTYWCWTKRVDPDDYVWP